MFLGLDPTLLSPGMWAPLSHSQTFTLFVLMCKWGGEGLGDFDMCHEGWLTPGVEDGL